MSGVTVVVSVNEDEKLNLSDITLDSSDVDKTYQPDVEETNSSEKEVSGKLS